MQILAAFVLKFSDSTLQTMIFLLNISSNKNSPIILEIATIHLKFTTFKAEKRFQE